MRSVGWTAAAMGAVHRGQRENAWVRACGKQDLVLDVWAGM